MIKPMFFNTEMVRAILEERKSVTRRVALKSDELRSFPCSSYPDGWWFRGRVYASKDKAMCSVEGVMRLCEYHPGDVLWVRETWAEMPYGIVYRADGEEPEGWDQDDRWRPSIHMRKDVARIFLRVKSVRVERLKDISEEGALAEGVPDEWPMSPVYCPYCKGEGTVGAIHPVSLGYMEVDCPRCAKATERFANLWDSTVKPFNRPAYGWEANPWVWVIEFERCDKPEEFA